MNKAHDHFVATGAYQDVDPVVLTSGKIGIYYVNTERLLQDGGKFAEYGDDHKAMVYHAIEVYHQKGPFSEVVDLLAERVDKCFRETSYVVSGGQRRDWIFSGPVAFVLDVPHVALYKNGKHEGDLDGQRVAHVADLLTAASSCYRIEDGEKKGWIPCIRQAGGQVNYLFSVVSRLQGGEENLAAQDVTADSLIKINKAFLAKYSQNPQAITYQMDDESWTRKYLTQHGALGLLKTFNPANGKLERAWKFLERYGELLKSAGKWDELSEKVKFEFDLTIER